MLHQRLHVSDNNRIGGNWECNHCSCSELISRLCFSPPLLHVQPDPFSFLLPDISTPGVCVKCGLFVYASHTVHSPPDEFPLPSIYPVVLICAFESEPVISRAFSRRKGKGREEKGERREGEREREKKALSV